MTTAVLPSVLDDVISFRPEIRPNCRSSGVATDEAIVSGLAPGSDAETCTAGNSTCGKGETGSRLYARIPESAIAMVSNVVAIGLRMNVAEMFTQRSSDCAHHCAHPAGGCLFGGIGPRS